MKVRLIDRVRQKARELEVGLISCRCPSLKSTLTFICPKCKEQYKITAYNFLYKNKNGQCSSCRRLRGENHPMFKHLSEEERQERNPRVRLQKYKEFFKKACELRGAVCEISNSKKLENLVAHHLRSWQSNPELREDPTNAVILTRKLHKQLHSEYGWDVTPEQYFEFRDRMREEFRIKKEKRYGKRVD